MTRYDDDDRPEPFAAIRFGDELAQEPVDWLWPRRIPRARLTLLVGDPGVGKSLLSMDLAARVSANLPFPDAPAILPRAVGRVRFGVILVCPEDDPEQALLPRLAAAGADPRAVCFLEGASPTPYRAPGLPPPPPSIADLPNAPTPRPAASQDTGAALRPREPDRNSGGGLRARESAGDSGAGLRTRESSSAACRTAASPIPDPRSPIPSALDLSISASLDLSPLHFPTHLPLLEQAIRALDNPTLVVIDPLHALLEPNGLTPTLAGLNEIARAKNVAILAVGHLTKTPSHRLIYRVRGSLAFIAAARAAMLLTHDTDHPDRRVLTTIKSVYGPPPPPLTFTITAGPTRRPATQTDSPGDRPGTPAERANAAARRADALADRASARAGTPSAALDLSISRSLDLSFPRLHWSPAPRPLPPDLIELTPDARSALVDACDWLDDYLTPGPRPVAAVMADARAAGHRLITLRRAKRILAVRSHKPDAESPWSWSLPDRLEKRENLADQGLDNEDDHLRVLK